MASSVACVDGSAHTPDGVLVRIKWKAWHWPDGEVRFELRRPLLDAHQEEYSSCFEVARFLRRHRGVLEPLFLGFNTAFDDNIFPSKSAFAFRRGDIGDRTKHEFASSTLGLLIILLWSSIHKHKLAARQRSMSLLVAAFGAVMVAEFRPDSFLPDDCEDAKNLCDQEPVVDGMCPHLKQALESSPAAGEATPQVRWAALLQTLLRASGSGCQAVIGLWRSLLFRCAEHINQRIAAEAFSADLRGFAVLEQAGRAKRKRADEDYKDDCTGTAVKTHRAVSGAAMVRADGTIDPSTARAWEKKVMRAYLEACAKTFAGCQILCISSDAGRIGDPPEETIFFLLWSPCNDRGAFLPVQAGFQCYGPRGHGATDLGCSKPRDGGICTSLRGRGGPTLQIQIAGPSRLASRKSRGCPQIRLGVRIFSAGKSGRPYFRGLQNPDAISRDIPQFCMSVFSLRKIRTRPYFRRRNPDVRIFIRVHCVSGFPAGMQPQL